MATLVDANALLDVLTEDEQWFDWSASMLEQAAHHGWLLINPIIYAEVCLGFARIEDVDDALPPSYYRRTDLPWAAGFWPREPSSPIDAEAQCAAHPCRTSISALTPR